MTDAPFRVLVTGSRTWTDTHAVYAALNAARADHPDLTVVHGAASKGADVIAAVWCRSGRTGVTEERHPAPWAEQPRSAGMVRNQEMVTAGAGLCLAFIADCASPRCARPARTGRMERRTARGVPNSRGYRPGGSPRR